MAAKKAPMRKTMAKPAAKKSNIRSVNAAEKRMMDKKNAGPKAVEVSYTTDKNIKGAKKAGLDARGRASKYGKPVSNTHVITRPTNSRKREIEASTTVKSSRGNYYTIFEDKNQVRFGRDSGRKTKTVPTDRYGNDRTRESYMSKYPSKSKKKK